MKKVLFFGACQVGGLADVYRRFVAPTTGDSVTWLKTWTDPGAGFAETVREADFIVEQVLSTPLKVTLDQFEHNAQVLRVPNVLQGFLWPYAMEPHPKNAPVPYLAGGPFNALESDRFLNGLMRRGVSGKEALQAYLDADIAKMARLERYYEISIENQRSIDERCGFDFANIIERTFRNEHLFAQPGHPNLRFSRKLISEVFRRMGIQKSRVEQIVASVTEPPFPRGETPVHPKIAEFFGLKWGHSSYKYMIFTGEYFTFEEYFSNYLDFHWAEKLYTSTMRARSSDFQEPEIPDLINDLRRGLANSPGTALGYLALADLLFRRGEDNQAVDALRAAIALPGCREEAYRRISEVLARRGELAEAERYVRIGIQAFPESGELYHWLGIILARGGWDMESILASRHAVHLRPEHPYYKEQLAGSLASIGEFPEAELLMTEAISLRPTVWSLHFGLSRMLTKQGRWADALSPAERALEYAPDRADVQKHIDFLKDRMRQPMIPLTAAPLESALAH